MTRQNRTLLNLVILGLIFFGSLLFLMLQGCASRYDGYFIDPSTNSTWAFHIKSSAEKVGKTTIHISPGGNVTMKIDGIERADRAKIAQSLASSAESLAEITKNLTLKR